MTTARERHVGKRKVPGGLRAHVMELAGSLGGGLAGWLGELPLRSFSGHKEGKFSCTSIVSHRETFDFHNTEREDLLSSCWCRGLRAVQD